VSLISVTVDGVRRDVRLRGCCVLLRRGRGGSAGPERAAPGNGQWCPSLLTQPDRSGLHGDERSSRRAPANRVGSDESADCVGLPEPFQAPSSGGTDAAGRHSEGPADRLIIGPLLCVQE